LDAEGISGFCAGVIFIPRRPSRSEGREFYFAVDFRPLSIVNADNRIIANTTGLSVEPLAAQGVSAEQRGFLLGRSLVCNVLDINIEESGQCGG
jgi:hypothetical protein